MLETANSDCCLSLGGLNEAFKPFEKAFGILEFADPNYERSYKIASLLEKNISNNEKNSKQYLTLATLVIKKALLLNENVPKSPKNVVLYQFFKYAVYHLFCFFFQLLTGF